MLRTLENADPSHMFIILYNILTDCSTTNMKYDKSVGLITKCILKLSKLFSAIPEGFDFGILFNKFNEYLMKVIKLDSKKLNSDLGAKTIRTQITELVKIKGDEIWVLFKALEKPHPAIEK